MPTAVSLLFMSGFIFCQLAFFSVRLTFFSLLLFFVFSFLFLTFIVASIMARILVPLILIVLYQQAQAQRKINWGKRQCDQVRPFLVVE